MEGGWGGMQKTGEGREGAYMGGGGVLSCLAVFKRF